jgi:uncharacterized protein (TIGR02271 family)
LDSQDSLAVRHTIMTSNSDGDVPLRSDAARSPGEETQADQALPLFAEELQVRKETRETGRLRVSKRTLERDVIVDEELTRERVEVETVPIGRRIEAMPAVRQEGETTIIPVVEEVLFVERRLMLKEEIRLTRVRTFERHKETVTLRHQEALVTKKHTDEGKV